MVSIIKVPMDDWYSPRDKKIHADAIANRYIEFAVPLTATKGRDITSMLKLMARISYLNDRFSSRNGLAIIVMEIADNDMTFASFANLLDIITPITDRQNNAMINGSGLMSTIGFPRLMMFITRSANGLPFDDHEV